jgi:hypothetical protein
MPPFSNVAQLCEIPDPANAEEEELRVLSALIGCIMVAEDAYEPRGGRKGLQHLSPPSPQQPRFAKVG